MKYSCTTLKIINIFILLYVTTFSSLYSQNNTDSPYSRYGIGLVKKTQFNGNFGLAGAGIAWRPYNYKPLINDSLAKSNPRLLDRKTNYINPVNPASFSNISLTTFEAAIVSRFVNYSSSAGEMNANNTYFNHMALAFPVMENWGAGFGIMPYSSVGYSYDISKKIESGDPVDFSYRGSGGLNKLFISNSVEIKNSLSLGFTASYLFGNISNEQRVVFQDVNQTLNTLEVNEIAVGDFLFSAGLQYFVDLGEDKRVSLGLVADLNDRMKAESSSILRSYIGNVDSESFIDTVKNVQDRDISVDIPVDYGIGLAYEKKGEWILMMEYKLRQWNDENYSENVSNSNSHVVNLGFEALADYSGIGSYLSRLGYRAGLHYNSSLLSIDGQAVSEYGISFGTSLPLRKTFSMIVIGVELGKRGTQNSNLIEESFINLHFGVTINDKWFIQNKYD